MSRPIPDILQADRRRAGRLAWWTILWMTSIIAVMAITMGQSQAMRTALIEDVLSVVPSAVLLIAMRFESKAATPLFPFGFERVHSLAFLVAAVALCLVGGFTLYEALKTLAMAEHITVSSVTLFGQQVWLGWLMIAALIYSVVPPFVLGRLKLPVARRLHDEVMHTDAMMQKADWMTGLAGIAGIVGIGFGLWWADAAAAAVIAFSILHDGVRAVQVATAELIDGVPRALGERVIAPDAEVLRQALQARWPDGEVRLRDSGRYILAEVCGVEAPGAIDLARLWPGDPDRAWRFAELSFQPPEVEPR